MKEREMRPAVTQWLESQGLYCIYEILIGGAGYCDVVGFSFKSRTSRLIPPIEKIIAVELKMAKISDVHHQAKRNQPFVTESYAAMPADFVVRMRPQSIQKFEDSGVGLLAVERAVGIAVFPEKKIATSDKLRRKLWRYKLKLDKEATCAMSKYGAYRGHPIQMIDDVWVYSDTKESVASRKDRPCGSCGLANTAEGHDGCLGALKNLMNACCGHGNIREAYIQYVDSSCIRGEEARSIIDSLKEENDGVN
ncbi:hypothetical protein LCGC14_1700300 [marine sediment metagenome]|uniref:Uncharacterized protein n=1 Tax=marine sediment metagenome TaxID=412755 RepID=A0A0F9I5W0_9ZZZZ